jgi:hypothetical protein
MGYLHEPPPGDNGQLRNAPPGCEFRNGDFWPIRPSPALEWCEDPRDWVCGEDYDPRPLPAKKIAALGDALDEIDNVRLEIEELERSPDIEVRRRADELSYCKDDLRDAGFWYFIAIRNKVWHEIAKIRSSKTLPTFRDGLRLRDESMEVLFYYEDLAKLGSGATTRDIINARAALALVEARFSIMNRRYNAAKRFRAAAEKEIARIKRTRPHGPK